MAGNAFFLHEGAGGGGGGVNGIESARELERGESQMTDAQGKTIENEDTDCRLRFRQKQGHKRGTGPTPEKRLATTVQKKT